MGSTVKKIGQYENLFGKFSLKLKLEVSSRGVILGMMRIGIQWVLIPQTWKQLQCPALPLYSKCCEVVDDSYWRWLPNEYHIQRSMSLGTPPHLHGGWSGLESGLTTLAHRGWRSSQPWTKEGLNPPTVPYDFRVEGGVGYTSHKGGQDPILCHMTMDEKGK